MSMLAHLKQYKADIANKEKALEDIDFSKYSDISSKDYWVLIK
jgi:hypothetical protein